MAPGMGGSSGIAGMAGVASAKGQEVMQVAMADPLLVNVKIGGLMTLYQSAQEDNAEAATAETDHSAAPVVAPPVEGTEQPEGSPIDPNMTDASGNSPPTAPTADGATATTDAASTPAATTTPTETPPTADGTTAEPTTAEPSTEAATVPALEGTSPESSAPAVPDSSPSPVPENEPAPGSPAAPGN